MGGSGGVGGRMMWEKNSLHTLWRWSLGGKFGALCKVWTLVGTLLDDFFLSFKK